MEAKLKFDEERGRSSLKLSTRKDIDQLALQPSLAGEQEFFDVLNLAKSNLKLEFYAKGSVGLYVDNAIQKILTDDSTDIYTELKAAQELAEKEGAYDFNKEFKK